MRTKEVPRLDFDTHRGYFSILCREVRTPYRGVDREKRLDGYAELTGIPVEGGADWRISYKSNNYTPRRDGCIEFYDTAIAVGETMTVSIDDTWEIELMPQHIFVEDGLPDMHMPAGTRSFRPRRAHSRI
jgi:hypothetical protein